MAFIPEVPEEEAGPELQQSYTKIREAFGWLPHFWQAQGSRPELMRANLELWGLLYRSGVLPSALKEEMMLVVSAVNSSSYCIAAHLELLQRLGVDKKLGRQIARDFESAELPEKEKSLFRFAAKLTREPFGIVEEDVSELRRNGWDNGSILEASLVASHANYLNRVASALGVVPTEIL